MAETKYSEQTRSWHRQVHEINAIRQNEISLFEAENLVKYCYNGDKWLYEDDSKDYKANDLLYEVMAFEEV